MIYTLDTQLSWSEHPAHNRTVLGSSPRASISLLFSKTSWQFLPAGSFFCNMISIRLNAVRHAKPKMRKQIWQVTGRSWVRVPERPLHSFFQKPVGFLAGWFFTTLLFRSLCFFNFRFSPLPFLCILYYNTSDFLIFVPCIYLLC